MMQYELNFNKLYVDENNVLSDVNVRNVTADDTN